MTLPARDEGDRRRRPDDGAAALPGERVWVGAGRSAQVYRVRLLSGGEAALKVFRADGAARAIQNVVLGHPNPYAWSPDACETAHRRRRVLSALSRALLAPGLRVASSLGVVRDEASGRLALLTEWAEGRPPRLRGPYSLEQSERELAALRRAMRAFQGLARASGMVGMLWQAGWGNPVAANNFLLAPGADDADPSVTWIDLESAYPPLASPSPWALLRCYLPRSLASALRRGQPLFDDVDLPRLRRFLAAQDARLAERLGPVEREALREDVEALGAAQARWKAVGRLAGQIAWRETSGAFSPAQAAWYRAHRVRFAGRVLGEALGAVLRLPFRGLGAAARALVALRPWQRLRALGAFYVSDAARQRTIDAYVDARLADWRARGQLAPDAAQELAAEQRAPSSRHLLADLLCQSLGTIPFSEALRATAAVLLVRGHVDPVVGGFVAASPGSVTRPLYALIRLVVGRARWAHALALPLSAAPLVGKAAYCVPLALRGARTGREGHLGAFLFYDTLSRLGRHVPLWGGRDTATEHFTNATLGRLLSAPARWLRRGRP